jgi:hypothetical protein
MENATQFDLNDALRQWREKMAASPTFRGADLDELEAHLRDSIQSLQTRGLSAHEAFWVAGSRLGENDLLEREFEKVNTERVWLNRVLWMVVGSIGIGLLSRSATTLIDFLTLGTYGLLPGHVGKPNPHLMGWFSLAANSVLLAGLIVWAFRSGRRKEGFLQRLGQWSLKHPLLAAAGVLLGYVLNSVGSYVPVSFILQTLGATESGVLLMFRGWWSLVPLLVWPSILAWLLMRTSRRATAR